MIFQSVVVEVAGVKECSAVEHSGKKVAAQGRGQKFVGSAGCCERQRENVCVVTTTLPEIRFPGNPEIAPCATGQSVSPVRGSLSWSMATLLIISTTRGRGIFL